MTAQTAIEKLAQAVAKDAITAEELRNCLRYDPETGLWVWLKPNAYHQKVGDKAGTISSRGYRRIKIEYRLYYAARLAFLYMTGRWPNQYIDHIDTDKSNDKWSNLREVTRAQNGWNRVKYASNKSGFKGVIWDKTHNKWMAYIKCNNNRKTIGYFRDPESAYNAYCKEARQLFGEYARL